MLPEQFFGQNVHFAVNLFAALVFFAVFWLYFDAWAAEKQNGKVLFRWLGFLLVSLSFLAQATVIEQTVLGSSALNNFSNALSEILVSLGFVSIIFGLVLDPLPKEPKVNQLRADEFRHDPEPATRKLPAVSLGALANPGHWFPPIGAVMISGLYWRRASRGMERHLKPISLAFAFIFVAELLSLASIWRSSTNPTIARLTEAFGSLWIIQLAFLLVGTIIMAIWVWKYLVRRFMSQLFMVFTAAILIVFLITAVSFTYLMVNNVQKTALDNLQTAAGVLNYAISSKESQSLADTETVAENPSIIAAVEAGNHTSLNSLIGNYLHSDQQSSLIITNQNAEILERAENPDRWGDSVSSDPSVRRALIGQSVSNLATQSGVLAPEVYIRAVVPIRDPANNQIVGTAASSYVLDNAFVDGIKQATGLDSSIYAGNQVSATTFLAPDGISRWVGVKETSGAVQSQVLQSGNTYKGTLGLQNRQYLSVFRPLKDVDNNIVGMLFIGQPQVAILQTAGHSVELTFAIAATLLILSIIPAYLVARHLARQLG